MYGAAAAAAATAACAPASHRGFGETPRLRVRRLLFCLLNVVAERIRRRPPSGFGGGGGGSSAAAAAGGSESKMSMFRALPAPVFTPKLSVTFVSKGELSAGRRCLGRRCSSRILPRIFFS
jgi:hypothetical protein